MMMTTRTIVAGQFSQHESLQYSVRCWCIRRQCRWDYDQMYSFTEVSTWLLC